MSVMRSSDGLELVLTLFMGASSGLRALAQLDLVGLQVIAVHLDAETRRRGELEAAVRIVQRSVDERIVLAQVPLRGFELVEIRNGHHHLRSGNHVDRSGRVVWRDRDVVSFAQSGNLLELGNAARPGDIRHDVVGELVLEDRHEIPLRMPALAPRDGGTDLVAHLLEGVKALGRTWLLEPVDLAGFLEAPAEANGGGDVEAAMRIDEDFDIKA